MQASEVQKSIDEILNIRKPRTIFHLIRMLFTVAKNFLLSMNALVLVLFLYILYHYIIRRRLIKYYVYRMLDKVTS